MRRLGAKGRRRNLALESAYAILQNWVCIAQGGHAVRISAILVTCVVGGSAAAVALAVPARAPSSHADDLSTAPADTAAVIDEIGPSPAARVIGGTGGSVFLAPAIGEVTVGRTADIVGRKVYADRSQSTDSTAVVSFSSRPPRPRPSASVTAALAGPLSQATVTSRFGALRAQGGGGTRTHAGIDLAAAQGSPVTAAYDGRVSLANWAGSYGLLVIVEHANGMQTRYAHLSRISVAAGQQVQKGQIVGLVGSTGRSTGPHLHFELRQDGRPVDPIAVYR